MSGVSMVDEYALAAETYALSTRDLNKITIGALRAGFGDWSTRNALIASIED